MNKFEQLKSLIASAEEDAAKFYDKGNKAAGTRLRKHMLDVKELAQEVRKDVSAIKDE